MADNKNKTAEDKDKKKKALLRRLREFLISKSAGTTVGGGAKQIADLIEKEKEGK